jgi:hypothetical protein
LCIRRVGITPRHLVQFLERLARSSGITADITNLLIVAKCDQVLRIGCITVTGVKLDEALGCGNRFRIGIALILRIGLHQDRLGGPLGVWMLALDLGELLHRRTVFAVLDVLDATVVHLRDGSTIRVGAKIRCNPLAAPEETAQHAIITIAARQQAARTAAGEQHGTKRQHGQTMNMRSMRQDRSPISTVNKLPPGYLVWQCRSTR